MTLRKLSSPVANGLTRRLYGKCLRVVTTRSDHAQAARDRPPPAPDAAGDETSSGAAHSLPGASRASRALSSPAGDWADLGLGPNHRLEAGEKHSRATRPVLRSPLVMDERTAQRFNAYALAAHPNEIGGLLRVVAQPDASLRVIDIRIFPHVAASSGYFELDGASIAQFNLDLVREGRASEISEWCGLIHSHPNMEPFLSGTDRVNVTRLAGQRHAFSVIVSTSVNPARNYHALHYAQGGLNPLVITYQPVHADAGASLSGTELLSPAEIMGIENEVAVAFANLHGRRERIAWH